MVAKAALGIEMRARKRKRELAAQAGVAFPGLPNDIAVSIVEKHLPDPADLAALREVSRGMRDAVDATGRKIEMLREDHAAERGYLSTLKCLRRRGRLSDERLLCAAAARIGDLDELKSFRAEGIPWSTWTCAYAAAGGHLKVLRWARANDCPWSRSPWGMETCAYAAWGGHLEVLKWARAKG